ITARLTFDGVTQTSPVTFYTSGFAPGDVFTFALQADQTITATGRYGYSVLVQVPGHADQTVTGSTFVVAQDASAFGAGWGFAGVDQLMSIAADAYDPSHRLDGITAIDGGLTTFTYSSGDVAIETVNGRTTTLTLDYSGNLASVTNPDGGVRTFTYDDSHRLTQEQFGILENNWE